MSKAQLKRGGGFDTALWSSYQNKNVFSDCLYDECAYLRSVDRLFQNFGRGREREREGGMLVKGAVIFSSQYFVVELAQYLISFFRQYRSTIIHNTVASKESEIKMSIRIKRRQLKLQLKLQLNRLHFQ